MARPQKQTVEYFSHDADASDGRTLSILFNHFGHEGLSAWWLLLERIAKTRNHVISIRNPEDIEFIAAKLHFKPDKLMEILSKMAELGAIDIELFQSGQIWCQNFVDRLDPVYKSRKQEMPIKPELSGKETELSGKETELSISVIPQTKLNYTKDTKLNYTLPSDNKIPEWLNEETWKDFLEMRKGLRAIPTENARALLIKELEKLKLAGDDPNEVLNQSIMNNYKGVFPLKKGGKPYQGDRYENQKYGHMVKK